MKNFVLRQEKKAFYEGSMLSRRSTGMKRLFDADEAQKNHSVDMPQSLA